MPVSPQDFVLYSRETGVPIPQTPEERMRMAPEVANFARNYAKAPSKFQEKGKAVAEGLKSIGTMGILAGLGLSAAGVSSAARGGGDSTDDPNDSYTPEPMTSNLLKGGPNVTYGRGTGQHQISNQTGVEKANRNSARDEFTKEGGFTGIAGKLATGEGLEQNPPSSTPTPRPDTPKDSVGPKSSGARPTLIRTAAEDFARNFLVQRGVQEASEPSVYFGEDMEPGSPEPGIKESGAVSYGGKSAGIQSIRALPEGGFGVQYQAYVPKGDKPYKGKPNYQYDVTKTPSQPKVPEGVRTYFTSDGNQQFNVGSGKKSMSLEDYYGEGGFQEKMDDSLAAYAEQEEYEGRARKAIKQGKIGTPGGISAKKFVDAVMSGNYKSIFPDDDGPNLDGGGPTGTIPPSPTDTPDAGPNLMGGGKNDSYDFTDNSPQDKNFTTRRGDQIVDKANIERAVLDDPWGSNRDAANFKDMTDPTAGPYKPMGDPTGSIPDDIAAQMEDKAPKSNTQKAEDLLDEMNKGREGFMAQDGPNKRSYDAKQRINKKTQDKRKQKTDPLKTLDNFLDKKQPENPLARGAQNLVGTGEVIKDIAKRGVEDTKEVVDNITTRASNFIDKQYQDALKTRDNIGDEQYRQEGLTKFKEAAAREREIRANLNKGGASLTPEQKSAAIRKMMTDEGYGDYLK